MMKVIRARPAVESFTASDPTWVSDGAPVISLASPSALDPAIAGAKGAALAQALSAGLPVLHGFVLTTEGTRSMRKLDGRAREIEDMLRFAYRMVSRDGTRPVVARSSSPHEDGDESSMAGMYDSVLGITDWNSFIAAVDSVASSGHYIDLAESSIGAADIAVLVQPHLDAAVAGVMFGVDPISGRRDRLSVVAVVGSPQPLVSGETDGDHYTLRSNGTLADPAPSRLLGLARRRQLASLAAAAEKHFGAPQDIEWAFDRRGTLHLLQSRPITAVALPGEGPVLGPGPVAETFPHELGPLEQTMWVQPLKTGIERALAISGQVSKKQLGSSPVLKVVGGRVAADLRLLGVLPSKRRFLAKLDPRGPLRSMLGAWSVGRLRAALPSITAATIEDTDRALAEVPAPSDLTNEQLLRVLDSAQEMLISLHGYEILAGAILPTDPEETTAAAVALRKLHAARSEASSDAQTIALWPETLALVPPSIGQGSRLPQTDLSAPLAESHSGRIGTREALRLRIRWVHELSARAAWELGRRLVPKGALREASDVRLLTLGELRAIVMDGAETDSVEGRSFPVSPPLPPAFRLAADGSIVPQAVQLSGGAKGAGGGRGMGAVHLGTAPASGDVLVVATLDPQLAPLLPSLGGIVSETGSALSHLAILAREFKVPVVVGMTGARQAFDEGTVVIVDGATGEVSEVFPS